MGARSRFRLVPLVTAAYWVLWQISAGLASPPTGAQATPPNPPTNLAITSIAGNRVSLRWVPSSEGVQPAGYVLEGGTAPGSVQGSLSIAGTASSFTFTAPSGTFFLRLHATFGGIRSAPSNEIEIAVNVPLPPSAPTGLFGLSSGSALTLMWQNTFAGGAASGILVDVTGDRHTSFPVPLDDRFSFSDVPAGTYNFAVRAFNATGVSTPSSPVTLTFPGSCPAPAMPINFSVSRVLNVVYASWSPAEDGTPPTIYLITVTGPLSGTFQARASSVYAALGPGLYTLSVQATNICGRSPATTVLWVDVPSVRTITVGHDLHDRYLGGNQDYSMLAPADGTLHAELRWNTGTGTWLGLKIGDRWFDGSPPIIARIPVAKGTAYQVTIAERQAPYDYGFNDAFVLTTRIEP